MATVILRSQNCFRDRHHPESVTLSHQSKSGGKSRTGYAPNHESGARRRNRSLTGSRSRSTVPETPAKNLVMEKVRILKRGESLTSLKEVMDCDGDGDGDGESESKREVKRAEDHDLCLGSTKRLGPDADTVQKQISFRKGLTPDGSCFSGSGFSVSPSPKSLPIPSFLARKN